MAESKMDRAKQESEGLVDNLAAAISDIGAAGSEWARGHEGFYREALLTARGELANARAKIDAALALLGEDKPKDAD